QLARSRGKAWEQRQCAPQLTCGPTPSSADFQSAVSPISNRPRVNPCKSRRCWHAAECNSALQQIENLRYGTARHSQPRPELRPAFEGSFLLQAVQTIEDLNQRRSVCL